MLITTEAGPSAAVAELVEHFGLAQVLDQMERLLDMDGAAAILSRQHRRFGSVSTAAYLVGLAADHVRRADQEDDERLPYSQAAEGEKGGGQ